MVLLAQTRQGTTAGLVSSGYQEAMIVVKGGYWPDRIVVEHSKPVRLSFRRQETASCSEMVILEASTSQEGCPKGRSPEEFVPEKPGEHQEVMTTRNKTKGSRFSLVLPFSSWVALL